MKIVHNENGSITATVSIPKELEEAIEEETNLAKSLGIDVPTLQRWMKEAA